MIHVNYSDSPQATNSNWRVSYSPKHGKTIYNHVSGLASIALSQDLGRFELLAIFKELEDTIYKPY